MEISIICYIIVCFAIWLFYLQDVMADITDNNPDIGIIAAVVMVIMAPVFAIGKILSKKWN